MATVIVTVMATVTVTVGVRVTDAVSVTRGLTVTVKMVTVNDTDADACGEAKRTLADHAIRGEVRVRVRVRVRGLWSDMQTQPVM